MRISRGVGIAAGILGLAVGYYGYAMKGSVSDLRDAPAGAESGGSQKSALVCGMRDLKARPWVQLTVRFDGKGTFPLEYSVYPFHGAELLPVPQRLDAEVDLDQVRVSDKRIYFSWGGDGDAAYATLRLRKSGDYAGTFYFPNGGVADLGDEAEVPVSCVLK